MEFHERCRQVYEQRQIAPAGSNVESSQVTRQTGDFLFRFAQLPKGIVLVRRNAERNISFTDVGTEELAHLEMIGAIVHQLTRCLNEDEIRKNGFDAYFVDHTNGVYPSSAAGVPWIASYIQSKGDAITDLHEDLAAEAATMYVQRAAKFA